MIFSTTKDDQFHDDFRMCLYSNLSLCYIHVLFTEREVKMAGYILSVNAERHLLSTCFKMSK